ncbi:hypothetical protein NDU88_005711 [Pleurodeles waltl]|uniref:Uncharacterized protein n=1 Tax=Pleurodeles waltl TaxID=8319 RepID=A0AAV7SMF2_PLEWA|nr:hypothetical protein NDU88_005711 [Pleurodeles waltl]
MADKVAEAIRLLQEAGRLNLLANGAELRGSQMRRAFGGVTAAVLARSPQHLVPRMQQVMVSELGRTRGRREAPTTRARGRVCAASHSKEGLCRREAPQFMEAAGVTRNVQAASVWGRDT